MILSCGEINGSPVLISISENKNINVDYTSVSEGLFSSAWYCDSCYIAAGSSDGKMLIERIDRNGLEVWDTLISAGFNIEVTNLKYTGDGTLLALGSAAPSSSEAGETGLLFIRIDTAGNIIEEKEITATEFISANNFTTDDQGNIFMALTRKSAIAKTRACVAKYNSDIQKLWETELYNNTSFGAASFGVDVDNSGNVYITGKTEVTREAGTLDNSFLACLDGTGEVIWKKYLENSNSGASLIIDNSGIIRMLNRNCFIINNFSVDPASPDVVTDEGPIRMFSVCNSYDTDAFGTDLDLYYDGNILTSGSKGGNFFLAVKSSSQ